MDKCMNAAESEERRCGEVEMTQSGAGGGDGATDHSS